MRCCVILLYMLWILDSRNTLGKTHDRCYYLIKCGPMVLSPLLSCGRWQGVAGLIRFRNACRDGITERWTSGGLMVMWGCHVVSFQCLRRKLWLNTMTRLQGWYHTDNATPICSNMWSCLLLLVVGCGCGSSLWLLVGFWWFAYCGSMSDMQWINQATPLFQQCIGVRDDMMISGPACSDAGSGRVAFRLGSSCFVALARG